MENGGWVSRRGMFLKFRPRQDQTTPEVFREDGVTFLGLLSTDFQECSQGLIPFTPWKIEIIFKDPDFAIWKPKEETIKYKLQVEDARVHIWMGDLNERIYHNLQSVLEKEAAKYHYRGRLN